MKRVIITGANSFIGYRLCKILTEKGYFVFAVIRKDNVNNHILNNCSNLKLIYAEMENYKNLDKLIQEKCDIGIAVAWNGTRGSDRNNESMQKQNYDLSINCIEAFIRLGCTKILTAGSQAEYGPWLNLKKVTENDKCRPNTAYGRYKLDFYNKAQEICLKKKVTLIEPRFFSLYGEDDSRKTMIISMVHNMLQNKPCKLTECKQLWDFLYIDDAINALFGLIESDDANGVYNFGSGISRPLKEFVIQMKELTKSNSDILFGSVPYPSTGIVNTNPCIEKLCKTINWKPQVSFECGIQKVVKFINEDLK